MNTKNTFLLLLLIVPLLSLAQGNDISLEYSPHLSNITNLEGVNSDFKFSHDVSVKYDHFISERINLTAKVGFTNLGYRIKGNEPSIDTSINITISSRGTDWVLYSNYLMLGIGNSFKLKNYFIAPEVGMGFLINSGFKTIERDSKGNSSPRKQKPRSGNFKFSIIPFSLSIGRRIELMNITPIVGIKAYYIYLRGDSSIQEQVGRYGFGLLLGIDF